MDRAEIHQLSMWPPHILTKNGTLSPSAMIPFCSLGQDIAKITTKIDQFDMPVCSIFEKIIFHDQLSCIIIKHQYKRYSDIFFFDFYRDVSTI